MRSSSKTFARALLLGCICFRSWTVSGVVRAEVAAPRIVTQAGEGAIKLDAAYATIDGPNARLEGGDDKDIIWWTSVDTSLRWTVNVLKPGNYRVALNYSRVGSNNGSPLLISVGDQTVHAVPMAGAGMNDYKTGDAGEVTLSKPGKLEVVNKASL
jgi:hypothetical protein